MLPISNQVLCAIAEVRVTFLCYLDILCAETLLLQKADIQIICK